MDKKLLIGIVTLFIALMVSIGVNVFVINKHIPANTDKYNNLQRQFDSINLLFTLEQAKLKTIDSSLNSTLQLSKEKSFTIDSLLKEKQAKKVSDAKKYRSIGNMSDDSQNRLLSDKLR